MPGLVVVEGQASLAVEAVRVVLAQALQHTPVVDALRGVTVTFASARGFCWCFWYCCCMKLLLLLLHEVVVVVVVVVSGGCCCCFRWLLFLLQVDD